MAREKAWEREHLPRAMRREPERGTARCVACKRVVAAELPRRLFGGLMSWDVFVCRQCRRQGASR